MSHGKEEFDGGSKRSRSQLPSPYDDGSSSEEERERLTPPTREAYIRLIATNLEARLRNAVVSDYGVIIENIFGEMVREYSSYAFNEGELRRRYKEKKGEDFDSSKREGDGSVHIVISGSDSPNAEFLASVDVLRRWSRNFERDCNADKYSWPVKDDKTQPIVRNASITIDGIKVDATFSFYRGSRKISVLVPDASNYVSDLPHIVEHAEEILHLMKHGKFAHDYPQNAKAIIANLACLMGIEEVHRNKATLATNIMFLEYIIRKKADHKFLPAIKEEATKLGGLRSFLSEQKTTFTEKAKTQFNSRDKDYWDKVNAFAEKETIALMDRTLDEFGPKSKELLYKYNMHPLGMINVSRVAQRDDRRRYDRAEITQDYGENLSLMHQRQTSLLCDSMSAVHDMGLSNLMQYVADIKFLEHQNQILSHNKTFPTVRCHKIIETIERCSG